MRKILTFGVWDLFHFGHLRLLQRCKALGDFLIVAVQKDEYVQKNKPNIQLIYNTEQRVEMIKSLKCVDAVVEYKCVPQDIKNYDFDIFVVGGDQNNDDIKKAIKWCNNNKKQVVVLERTPNISSTKIRSVLDY